MHKFVLSLGIACASVPLAFGACQSTVHVQPDSNWSSRKVESQTHESVIRDYLESWQSLRAAFASNNVGLLEHDFVGSAREKLSASISQQAKAGISSDYCDRAHDLQITFYSPDGLSIQVVDMVNYEESVVRQGKLLATHQFQARYVAVLTPSATRWRVRIFQAEQH